MIRKTISLTALLSFILLMLTSIILYIIPAGRVAYWADYHLGGSPKHNGVICTSILDFYFLLQFWLTPITTGKPLQHT